MRHLLLPVERNSFRSFRSLRSIRPTLEPLEDRLALTVFTVLNTDDVGAGSLRQAILDANTTPNGGVPDEIHFNIPDPGVQTIQPTSPLPSITDPVKLDEQHGVTAYGLCVRAGPGLGVAVQHDGIGD